MFLFDCRENEGKGGKMRGFLREQAHGSNDLRVRDKAE